MLMCTFSAKSVLWFVFIFRKSQLKIIPIKEQFLAFVESRDCKKQHTPIIHHIVIGSSDEVV